MVAVSPDGGMVAFLAGVPGGPQRLWLLRTRDALEAWPLLGTEGAEGPFWRPDGQSLGFFASGQLKTVPVAGGAPQTICKVTGSTTHATWNQAGDILFAGDQRGVGGLRRVSAEGGTVTSETTVDRARGETGHLWPYFLPDGRHFLYIQTGEDGGGIYIGSLGAKQVRRLLDFSKTDGTSSVAYAAPGYVLFVLGGTLMAQPFDAARLEKTGEPIHVAEGVLNNGAGTGGAFSVSANSPRSVLAYWGGGQVDTARLAWFTRDGTERATSMKADSYGRLSLAPDGERAAVEHVNASGSVAIWLLDLMRGTTTPFTSDVFSVWPIWAADGASVIFASMRDGALAPYRQSVTAREDAHRLFTTNAPTTVTDSSADGTILYQTGNFPRDDIGVFALSNAAPPRPFLHTAAGVSDGHLSPDGRWMAYVSLGEVYVTSFSDDAAGPWRISTNGGSQPRWGPNGMELYYLARPDHKVMAVKVTTTPRFTVQPAGPALRRGREQLCGDSRRPLSARHSDGREARFPAHDGRAQLGGGAEEIAVLYPCPADHRRRNPSRRRPVVARIDQFTLHQLLAADHGEELPGYSAALRRSASSSPGMELTSASISPCFPRKAASVGSNSSALRQGPR